MGATEPQRLEAVVLGRVGVDLYPNELETPLSEVHTFTRFVGGFAGNVATGLARLGVRTAIAAVAGALVAAQLACSEAMPRLEELERSLPGVPRAGT